MTTTNTTTKYAHILKALAAKQAAGWSLAWAFQADVAKGLKKARAADWAALEAFAKSQGWELPGRPECQALRAMACFWFPNGAPKLTAKGLVIGTDNRIPGVSLTAHKRAVAFGDLEAAREAMLAIVKASGTSAVTELAVREAIAKSKGSAVTKGTGSGRRAKGTLATKAESAMAAVIAQVRAILGDRSILKDATNLDLETLKVGTTKMLRAIETEENRRAKLVAAEEAKAAKLTAMTTTKERQAQAAKSKGSAKPEAKAGKPSLQGTRS